MTVFRFLSAALLLPVFLWNLSLGQTSPQGPATGEELAAAVVSLRAEIPPSARTAGFLGTRREGSGVLIGPDQLILTIGYLILEAERVHVADRNNRPVPAEVVGYDSETGFGLVRAKAPLGGTPLPLGDSSTLKEQDPVLVVSKGGTEGIRTAVVVSRRTFAGYWEYLLDRAIFTAPPHSEFAGAALIDGNFQLVGIGSLFVKDSPRPGLDVPGNLFIPINRLKPILSAMVRTGRPGSQPRPWLGLSLGEQFGRVMVTRVSRGGPAERSGLQPGDIILEVDGRKVDGMETLYRVLWGLGDAGVVAEFKMLQGHEITRVSVTTEDRSLHYRTTRKH